MKTSNVIKGIVLGAIILVFWIGIAYSAMTRPSLTTPATTTPTPQTDEKPGSLLYEETVHFNGADLIKKDIPVWLVDAILTNDPVVVAREMAKRPEEDFGVRSIKKSSDGFYSWREGYIRNEEGMISVADNTYADVKESTVELIVPEKLTFDFVESVVKILWAREGNSFWTKDYEHFVQIKEMPFPSSEEMEDCILIDGRFVSIMPDTTMPPEGDGVHRYADKYYSRSVVWYAPSEETFYTIKSYNSMIHKWKWSTNGSLRWELTGKVPTLPESIAVADAWQCTYCWYVVKGPEGVVTVYEPYEKPESKEVFGIRPIFQLEFKGAMMTLPFVDYEGSESWNIAYIATPETNTLWRISPNGISKSEVEKLEITEDRVICKNGEIIEVLASKENDRYYGAWVGYCPKMIGELEFQMVTTFEEETKRINTSGTMKNRDGRIIIEAEDITITPFYY